MIADIELAVIGLCSGGVIASGVVAFIITLGIVPRFAGITRTAGKIRLYEDFSMLGAVLGTVLTLWGDRIPLYWIGNFGVGLYGLFAGIFLGAWIIALAEVVNIFPIMVRRIGLTRGLWIAILAVAIGKTLGTFYYFWSGI